MDGCEVDSTFRPTKVLFPADVASLEKSFGRLGVASDPLPVAGFSGSFAGVALEDCDKLENAGPSAVRLPNKFADGVDAWAFDSGFAAAVPGVVDGAPAKNELALIVPFWPSAVGVVGIEGG